MNEEQSKWVAEFSAWGVQLQAYTELELVYRQNMILAELGAQSMVEQPVTAPSHSLSDLTTWLLATRQDLGPETWQQDIARARLLNIVTPSPDKLQANFKQLYAESPERAVSYYYELSRAVENVKVADIERNIQYLAASSFGELEITINLSKPEKTTAEIAAAAKAPKSSYPPTALDYTNEGFAGSVNQPARSTHRFIRDELQGKTWGWHYSPYAYFEEHAIFVDFVREQMTIDVGTFTDLLAIVAKYPMYFVGSNADLPIVGGSILSQEHFQGGRHVFPLMLAPTELPVDLPDFPTVTAAFI
jgi:UDPglucose--hexose-1-phosphate uridylyltransferase